MKYGIAATKKGYDATTVETMGEHYLKEFDTLEEAEAVVADLESDKEDYGLGDVTYTVGII